MAGNTLGNSNHERDSGPSGHFRVFRACGSDGSLSLSELNATDAARGYRRWLASLDEKAVAITVGKPSDEVAYRILEVAETFLRKGDVARATEVIRLVAESKQFKDTREHALASAALKTLGQR